MKKTNLLFILSCFLFASCGTDKFANGGFAKRKYRDGIYVARHDKTEALDKNKVNSTVAEKESEVARVEKGEKSDSLEEKREVAKAPVVGVSPAKEEFEKQEWLQNRFFKSPMKSIVESKKLSGAIKELNSKINNVKNDRSQDASSNWMGIVALVLAVLAIIMLVLSYYALILLLAEVAAAEMLVLFLVFAFVFALAAAVIGGIGLKEKKKGNMDRTFGVLSTVGMIMGLVIAGIMLIIGIVVGLFAALLSGI